jgi:beta-galactosidase
VLLDVLKEVALAGPDQQLPTAVWVRHGVNRLGKRLHYYFNYSGDAKSFAYSYAAGKDLPSGITVGHSQSISLKPWDVAIVEEQ